MTPQEANKIIAEFMGGPYSGDFCQTETDKDLRDDLGTELYCTKTILCNKCYEKEGNYYLSLDALVPVWEKLGKTYLHFVTQYNEIHIEVGEIEIGFAKGKTIQEAAAIATAKAILEFK